MPENKDFALRIELIDQCLRNKLRQWTLDSLVDAINEALEERYGKRTSKRTIQNDLRYLREQRFAPIKRIRVGTVNYFSYEESFSIKNLPISSEEITFLQDGIKILRQVNDFRIIDDVEAIINKLQNTVNANIPDQSTFIQFEKHHHALGVEFIDPLFVAIRAKLCLRITYQSFNAIEATELLCHPYLLKEYRNRWFLFCRKRNSNQITTLALDRIKSIKNSSHSFIENDLFDPQTYFEHVIGVSIPDNALIENIEIKVNLAQAPYVLTKPIHQSQRVIKRYKNGDLMIALRVMPNFELKALLLSFANAIEIRKPISLRNEIAHCLRLAANQYHKKNIQI